MFKLIAHASTRNAARLTVLMAGLLVAPAVFGAALPLASTLTGLNPGDTYQFVFVTSGTIGAGSGSLSTYNTFVQNAANSAGFGNTISMTWTASASTGSSPNRALDNAPIAGTTKVYLLDGTMVADGGSAPFYPASESVNHLAAINLTELLTTVNGNVWTGGNTNGSESGSGLLGSGRPVYGFSGGANGARGNADSWARVGNDSNTIANHLYAVSNALVYNAGTVSTPEPGYFAPVALALIGFGVRRLRTRA